MSLDPDAIARARGRVRQKSVLLFTTEYLALFFPPNGGTPPDAPTSLNGHAGVLVALMDVLVEAERACTAAKVARQDTVEAVEREQKLRSIEIPSLTNDIERLRSAHELLHQKRRRVEQYRIAVQPIERLPSKAELQAALDKEVAQIAKLKEEMAHMGQKVNLARCGALQLLRSIDDVTSVLERPQVARASSVSPNTADAPAPPMDLSN